MGGFQGILIDPRTGVLMGGSDPQKGRTRDRLVSESVIRLSAR